MSETSMTISGLLVEVLNIARWIVIIQFIMSWLIQFEVLNRRQPIVEQAWVGINRITSPIYQPLRRVIPPVAGMDFTPIIVIFAIRALQILLINNPF
jgi:YggT family protein